MSTTRTMSFNFLTVPVFALIVSFSLANCGGGGGGGAVGPPAKTSVKIARTGEVVSYATGSAGDDGALQVGAAWPDPRFTAVSSGTGTMVTDNLTGLIWAGDGGTPTLPALCTGGTMSWQPALDYVACLNSNNYLNHNDWRLPNRKELRSLADYSQVTHSWLNTQGFSNALDAYYWSSTTYALDPNRAWLIYMRYGSTGNGDKSGYGNGNVWPVRSGQ